MSRHFTRDLIQIADKLMNNMFKFTSSQGNKN